MNGTGLDHGADVCDVGVRDCAATLLIHMFILVNPTLAADDIRTESYIRRTTAEKISRKTRKTTGQIWKLASAPLVPRR